MDQLQTTYLYEIIVVMVILQRDAESQRVVMESLYRLLWVYVVRIKCEGNVETDTGGTWPLYGA